MRRWIHATGSTKLAVALLAVIATVLAAGTLVESRGGPEAASRLVYDALWFSLLLGLLALNIACSLADLFPWGWKRAGFVLTHASILIVLAGSLVTLLYKVEGRLSLWEGQESVLFVESGRIPTETPGRRLTLPFSVRLDSFEIDYYQGTRRPAMFRSRVTVNDPAAGASFPAVIEMNKELSYAGFRLFQSSYQQTPGGDQTILTVSRDPGQPVVFAGYTLLMLGMATVLATRIVQRRAARRLLAAAPAKPRTFRRVAALGAAAGLALAASAAGGTAPRAAELPEPGQVAALRRLPVQHDGRVMPLDTLAREAVWNVTARAGWRGLDPAAIVLGWTFDPEGWAAEPLVAVEADLGEAVGLKSGRRSASFRELAGSPRMAELARRARAAAREERPLSGLERRAQRVEERLLWMQGFFERTSLRVVPDPSDPRAAWRPVDRAQDAAGLIDTMTAAPAGGAAQRGDLDREVRYNRLRPSRLAWWILLAATAAALLAWRLDRRWIDGLSLAGLASGFAVMTGGLAVRWQVAGRIPASNMYESLLFLAWGVGLFALVALVFLRTRLVVLNATAMSALTMLLADRLPLDPFVHPMPPVLSGTPWLAIHVPIIMVSYSVLVLGVLCAHMQIGVEAFAPSRRESAARMNDLLYWYLHVGAILLIAGILTGSIWAASSWGRYWGWDPKEVWSLVAFLCYLGLLHGRLDQLLGRFGFALLSIVAFWTIVMTYVGVNFVLAAGLHSYGFGGSGVVRWLALAALAETAYLASAWAAHRANQQRLPAPPAPA